ncbi:MAG: SMC family ATPase [Dehalococcoidia bacterium]|nr:SMC family ATPase [Dehalococcoidia bacterium]
MIPVNLRMRNFMPYRGEAQSLSFAPIHTACISGDNGAGKSSVIDAITWALWGKSRAKSDDDLIHQGENEAEVEFDFNAGGQLYRVIRRHARPKGRRTSGQSSLDLYIYNSDIFLPVTSDRIRQTEDKIKSILHMDYDTFINSAYLRQGHADEFTRQDPAKRKEVLASILGLEVYDSYEECAKGKSKDAQQYKLHIVTSISDIENKLIQKPKMETEFVQAEERYKTISSDIHTAENKLKQLRQEGQRLAGVKAQLEQLNTSIKRTSEDLQRKTEKYQASQQRIKEYKTLLAHQTEIESSYQQLQKVTNQCEEMDQQMRQIFRLREECKPYENTCNEHKNKLILDREIIEKQIKEYKTKAEQIPELKSKQQELSHKRQVLAQTEKDLGHSNKALRSCEADLSHLYNDIKRIQQDIAEIEEKQHLLAETKSEIICPLCESDLSSGRLELVQSKYSADKAIKLHAIDKNNKAAAELNAQLNDDKSNLSQREENYKKDASALDRQEERITQALNEANDAVIKMQDTNTQLETIIKQMATQDYAHAEREELTRIEAKIAALYYDEKRHDELQKEKQRLHGSEKQKHDLDEAIIRLQQEQESATTYAEDITAIQKQQMQDSQVHQQLTQQLEKLANLQQELLHAENSFQQQATEQQVAREQVAIFKEKLAQLTEMEKHSSEKLKELSLIAENESLYKQMSQIFGKKGIQAMLIETALPEIESEANHLLGRMTDGRMTLTFETQQATKKGDVAETLDIKIADELGTRNYEMFSGGEGFRIDFAVRIALSRLLARRAGAPLPTLIIDEGFGTQDTDGIEKLKESINSIKDDFQKILVITHIEELKDAFPVRMNIVKDVEGSRIEVS